MKPLIPWFEVPVFEIPLGDTIIPLHGFGLLVAMGFIFGGKAAIGRANRMGLDGEAINRLITWLVVGTFVGGHVGYGLMYEPEKYLANPGEFLKVWQGLSSFGGFVVCVPLSIWFFRREKLAVWSYLDCLAYGMALGWFLGRMGCFVAHDHPGTPADDFFLGVLCRPDVGPMIDLPAWMVQGDGVPNQAWGPCARPENSGINAVHDMGLYEALWSLTMFGILSLMDRRAWKPGTLVLTFGLAYGPVRFAMDFLRPEYSDARYAGFTPGQYWAAVFTVVCVGALIWRVRSTDAPVGPPARRAPEAA